jgi:hypothetical protein
MRARREAAPPQTTGGATPAEWTHFDLELELSANLLPCVPANALVPVKPGSSLEGKIGKIPSAITNGYAHGLQGWQKREILPAELALWRKDGRLNICVRTGPISGVYAIDCDVGDATAAAAVHAALPAEVGAAAIRTRPNSGKWLLPFRLSEGSCKKRILKTGHGNVELLGLGQQFVAAGSHSSGVRYCWSPSLPSELPTLTLDQLNKLWKSLTAEFGTSTSTDDIDTDTSASGTATPDSDLRHTATHEEWDQLKSALRALMPHCEDNSLWSEIGYALLSLQSPHPGRAVWLDFSRKAQGFEAGAPERWWQGHQSQTPRTDYRHIFTLARRFGWGASSDPAIFGIAPAAGEQPDAEAADGDEEADRGAGAGHESAVDAGEPAADKRDDADADAGAGADAQPQRPVIRLTAGALHIVLNDITQALRNDVVQHGDYLRRLVQETSDIERKYRQGRERPRTAEPTRLLPINPDWARARLTELATIMKWDGRSNAYVQADAPLDYLRTWLAQGTWENLRTIEAVMRAPFVRLDGSICDTPGYDEASYTLYAPSDTFPPIPEAPTRDDAFEALQRLREVVSEFPWKDGTSETSFLAHIFSEVTRMACAHCPMFWYTAPRAGEGKTLLSELPSLIVHGAEPSLHPWVAGEEMRKMLTAALHSGERSILLDNAQTGGKIRGSELCAFLTSANWSDRKLGETESLTIPNRAVLSATGNNVTPTGDLARRSFVIRLDANMQRTRDRVFKIDNLREYVLAHRATLLVDVLTILKAYYTTGELEKLNTLPSFETWTKRALAPLLWLGMPNPMETQAEETDDGLDVYEFAFQVLGAHFGGRPFTAPDVAKFAGSIADSEGQLVTALLESGCTDPSSPQKIGYWLREARDQIWAGYKLASLKHTKRGVAWQLKQVTHD